MTGPVQPVTPAGSADSFRIWEKDRPRVEQEIVEGCAFTPRELLQLHTQRLQKAIQRGLAAGRTVEEVMRELDSN